jgi:carbonic anhydrase
VQFYFVTITHRQQKHPQQGFSIAGRYSKESDCLEILTIAIPLNIYDMMMYEVIKEELRVPLVVVMGHTSCGAVAAATKAFSDGHDNHDGYFETISAEIQLGLKSAAPEMSAVCANVLHSMRRVSQSAAVNSLIEEGGLQLMGAEYDLKTGYVDFFE